MRNKGKKKKKKKSENLANARVGEEGEEHDPTLEQDSPTACGEDHSGEDISLQPTESTIVEQTSTLQPVEDCQRWIHSEGTEA